MLGTGVNFNPYFVKTCFACSFMMVEERFMSLGLIVSVILDRPEVGLSTKKNHLQLLFFMPVLSFCPKFPGDCHFFVASFLPAKFCLLNRVLVPLNFSLIF